MPAEIIKKSTIWPFMTLGSSRKFHDVQGTQASQGLHHSALNAAINRWQDSSYAASRPHHLIPTCKPTIQNTWSEIPHKPILYLLTCSW